MKVSAKLTGLKAVQANVHRYSQALLTTAKKEALLDCGEKLGELSAPLVPVEYGNLKSTFTVLEINRAVYAGYNTEYAAYQHQGMREDGSHIIVDRPGGGESFFLSGPLMRNLKQFRTLYNQRIKIRLATLL